MPPQCVNTRGRDTRRLVLVPHESTPAACECGCGDTAKSGNRYIHGHNSQAAHQDYAIDDNGCWIWQRSAWRSGYPRMKVAGKWTQAYRVYYERHVGPIPEGMTLDHLCRRPLCVNPDHLEPVSLRENQRRADLIKLDEDAVRVIRASQAPQQVLAARFGVTPSTIYFVQTYRTWRHVVASATIDRGSRGGSQ
jgi:HNH endonuclease